MERLGSTKNHRLVPSAREIDHADRESGLTRGAACRMPRSTLGRSNRPSKTEERVRIDARRVRIKPNSAAAVRQSRGSTRVRTPEIRRKARGTSNFPSEVCCLPASLARPRLTGACLLSRTPAMSGTVRARSRPAEVSRPRAIVQLLTLHDRHTNLPQAIGRVKHHSPCFSDVFGRLIARKGAMKLCL